jgi:SAM-dependent methyltransferase
VSDTAAERSSDDYYADYWVDEFERRERTRYYERRYDAYRTLLAVPEDAVVADVGGGNGQVLRYLGVKRADVLDISDSGLAMAESLGYRAVKADLQRRFPVAEETYDVAVCFEVLEHLWEPLKTLAEVANILKEGGELMLAQPNTPADGVHHVRRIYVRDLLGYLEGTGFAVEAVRFIPATTLDDESLPEIWRCADYGTTLKLKKTVWFGFRVLVPRRLKEWLARAVPDRFAVMYVIIARKRSRNLG